MSRGKEVASNSRGILLFPRRTSNFLGWTAWLSFSFLFFPVSRRFVTFESILLFLHPDSQGPSSSILSRIRPVAPAHWLAARIYTDFLPISSPFSRNKSCVFAYKRPFNITEALIYRHEERPCILPLPLSTPPPPPWHLSSGVEEGNPRLSPGFPWFTAPSPTRYLTKRRDLFSRCNRESGGHFRFPRISSIPSWGWKERRKEGSNKSRDFFEKRRWTISKEMDESNLFTHDNDD